MPKTNNLQCQKTNNQRDIHGRVGVTSMSETFFLSSEYIKLSSDIHVTPRQTDLSSLEISMCVYHLRIPLEYPCERGFISRP